MRGLTHLWQHVRNYWSLVEKWCRILHTAPTLHHRIIIYFEVYKTSWMVKTSVIMMTSNRILLSFLVLRTRNSISAGSWSYQKDSKRPLNRMEYIWLIKVHFVYRKNWILFHTKKTQLLSRQSIAYQLLINLLQMKIRFKIEVY